MNNSLFNDYLMPLAGGALMMWLIYQRFGPGLATRIFAGIVSIGTLASLATTFSRTRSLLSPETIAVSAIVTGLSVWAGVSVYRSVVVALERRATSLQASTAQLGSTAKEAAATAAQQAAMVAEVSATIQEIQATSAAAADSARQVVSEAAEAVRVGREGREAVAEARRILDVVAQVAGIVDTVSEIAEKSTLLAVNASIEAARAGEHGRGFAVVASQVHNLAEQSKAATRQIRDAIQRTEQGRRAVDVASEVISRLSHVLDETTDKAKGIAGATQQQAAGIQQIADAMTSVSQGAQETAAAARQIEGAVHELEGVSTGIRDLIGGKRSARS